MKSDYIYAIIIIMKKTIIVDTSVIISALIGSKGAGREIIRQCLNGHYLPLISNALFSEYEDVTKREKILQLCPLTKQEISELLHSFYSVAQRTPIYFLWRPNIKDEGDNFLIELALAGNANCIITNNIGDFILSELNFPGLDIVTPEQFLKGE